MTAAGDEAKICMSSAKSHRVTSPQLETRECARLFRFSLPGFTCKGLNLAYRIRAYRAAVDYLKANERYTPNSIFLGGRSMGACAAVAVGRLMCAELKDAVQGLLCLSFPLHPHTFRGAKTSVHCPKLLCCLFLAQQTTCVNRNFWKML